QTNSCQMGSIRLKNIRIYAYHGCLAEESKIGSEYRVDLEIKTDLRKSTQSDALEDTVDYVALHRIVTDAMQQRSNLLENVAQRIVETIFERFPEISRIHLEVAKLNPPIGGDVESVSVILEEYRN